MTLSALVVASLLAAGVVNPTPQPRAQLSFKATGGTQWRNADDRLGDVVNVLEFIPTSLHAGIKANTNTTPLQSYIQAAITDAVARKASRVFLPAGTYYVTGAVAPYGTVGPGTVGVTLAGAGSDWTFISPDADATTDVVQFHNATLYGAGGGVEGLTIRGRGDVRTKFRRGVSFSKWASAHVRDVRVWYAADAGTWIFDTFDVVYDRFYTQYCEWGVYVASGGETFPTTLRFNDCYLGKSYQEGMNLWAAQTTVVGTIVEKSGLGGTPNSGSGIKLRSGSMNITSAYFEANLGHDVWIGTYDNPQYSTTFSVSNCYHYTAGLKAGGYAGIYAYRTSGGTIIGGHYADFITAGRRPIKIGDDAAAKHIHVVQPTAMTLGMAPVVTTGADVPVLLQDYQGVIEYLDAAGLDVITGNHRLEPKGGIRLGGSTATMTTGAAAPATGAHVVGEVVWNTAPAAGGTPGWVCTTAGTPGTWKAMANLAP